MGPGGGTYSTFTAGDGYEFHVMGPEGGPFPEGRRNYWVKNDTTDRVLRWSVSATEDWLTFSERGGLLGPGARTEVLVTLDDDFAATLPVGEYPADIVFRDARSGVGEIYLSFLLTVFSPSDQSLVVTPEEAFTTSGPVGGPLDQETKVYYLENQGTSDLNWRASGSEPWIVFQSPVLGTLVPKERVGVVVAIDPSIHGLGSGTHQGTVDFANLTDNTENTSRDVIVTLDPASGDGRVTDGLQVLYDFTEGSGAIIEDRSGVQPPVNLQIADTSKVQWLPGALRFTSPTIAQSQGSPARLSQAIVSSKALTLEAWIEPANTTQDGPARILTLSNGSHLRNFTLGQGLWDGQPSDTFNVRLRTTATDEDGMPLLTTGAGAATTSLQHVVYTRDAAGKARIYVNSQLKVEGTVGGDLSNWASTYGLALGNEIGAERPWLGSMALVAIYDRALSGAEVGQNFLAGSGDDDAGQLTVDPYSDFTVHGTSGEDDFSTPTTTYTVANPGGEAIDWKATCSEPWVFVTSANQGTLAPGSQSPVDLEVDVARLKTFPPGTYQAVVEFINLTNDWGTTTRNVIALVGDGGGQDGGVPRPDEYNTGPRQSPTWTLTSSFGSDPMDMAWVNAAHTSHPSNVFQENGRWILHRIRVNGQVVCDTSLPGVTFRDCTIDAGNCIKGQSSQNCFSGGSGHRVEYCRMEGSTSPAFVGGGWTFEHCRFTEIRQHGFQGGYNNTFRYNLFDRIGLWLDDPDDPSDYPHSESGILFQGNNFIFEYNYVDLPYPMPEPPPGYTGYANPTACINFDIDVSNGGGNNLNNSKCNYNWFNGGGFTLYMLETQGAKIHGLEMIGNRLSKSYQYGQLSCNFDYISRAGVTVTGNVSWDPATGATSAPEFQQE